jgi:hypothetical protein
MQNQRIRNQQAGTRYFLALSDTSVLAFKSSNRFQTTFSKNLKQFLDRSLSLSSRTEKPLVINERLICFATLKRPRSSLDENPLHITTSFNWERPRNQPKKSRTATALGAMGVLIIEQPRPLKARGNRWATN